MAAIKDEASPTFLSKSLDETRYIRRTEEILSTAVAILALKREKSKGPTVGTKRKYGSSA